MLTASQNSTSQNTATKIDVHGIPLHFPVQPYALQVNIMEKTIFALQNVIFCE